MPHGVLNLINANVLSWSWYTMNEHGIKCCRILELLKNTTQVELLVLNLFKINKMNFLIKDCFFNFVINKTLKFVFNWVSLNIVPKLYKTLRENHFIESHISVLVEYKLFPPRDVIKHL